MIEMLHIDPPTINAKRHFLNCISSVKSKPNKEKLEKFAPIVDKAAKKYKKLALAKQLHSMRRHYFSISDKVLKRIYDYRMVNKSQPGRKVYDQIILSAPNGFCPFCAQRRVTSVDHYLSKSAFPELATVPINLVPCCLDCNKTKDTYISTRRSSQLLHPYFDFIKVRWLQADIADLGGHAVFVFSVALNTTLPKILVKRIENHLQVFKLLELYSMHATAEMRDIQYQLEVVRSKAGTDAVEEHLLEHAKSREKSNPNSWQTAAYYAMHKSTDFCEGRLKC